MRRGTLHMIKLPGLAVVIAMLAGLLSACGGAPATEAPAATTAPAATAAATEAPAAATEAPATAAATEAPATAAATEAATEAPAATAAATAGAAAADLGDFSGVEINIVTQTGPAIAGPLQRRGAEFAEATGATVNVTSVPFGELYQRILTDLSTGTNSFSIYVFAPQWMVDFVEPGYMEDLTDRVNADQALNWNDVGTFFRDFSASYKGRVFTIPLDGDFQMAYYRIDVLEELGLEPPRTWEEYLAIAEAANGRDMNNDGEPDYGSCIGKKPGAQSYWFITSIAGGMIQTQGTSQGAFFNTEDFTPLTNNAAFAKALDIYKQSTQFGPPDELNLDVADTRPLFTAGRCALTLDWGDVGTLSIDPVNSQVNGVTGAVIMPGSTEVLDRATGELVPCTPELCPHAIDGVNHAPFAAFGGWSGGINAAADPAVKDAAYAFLSYMNQPAQSNVDVTIGATGFNPYRISQLTDFSLWEQAGMSAETAEVYLGAIQASLENPNMVLDLRIPQNQRYQGQVLDTALAQFLADEIDRDTAMQQIFDGWEEITEELGRDVQREAYIATLGVQR